MSKSFLYQIGLVGGLIFALAPTASHGQPLASTKIKQVKLSPDAKTVQARERQLTQIIATAQQHLKHVRETVNDYSCRVTVQTRVDGRLTSPETMSVKFRAPKTKADRLVPFSLVLEFLNPKGRKVLYVDGQNDNRVIIKTRDGGLTHEFRPENRLLTKNGFGIKDFGVEQLLVRLMDGAQTALAFKKESLVRVQPGIVTNGRKYTFYELKHPVRRRHFGFHIAQVWVDDEYQIPVQCKLFDWPEEANDAPVLMEKVIYSNIHLNPALKDIDFDRNNPAYGFGSASKRRGASKVARK